MGLNLDLHIKPKIVYVYTYVPFLPFKFALNRWFDLMPSVMGPMQVARWDMSELW